MRTWPLASSKIPHSSKLLQSRKALFTPAVRCQNRPSCCHCSPLSSLPSEKNTAPTSAPPSALLLDLDGAVLDMQLNGHRVALNRAFVQLGYEVRAFVLRALMRPFNEVCSSCAALPCSFMPLCSATLSVSSSPQPSTWTY